MQIEVAFGELFEVADCRRGGAGVASWVGGGRVEQSEHGPAAGQGVFPGRDHLRGQRGPGGPELVEQAGGMIEHGYQ
jgi:hypothetical protein